MDVSSYVDKIVKAKANAGGNVIRDGEYTVAVRKLLIEPSVKGSEVWFKAEFYVIEAAAVSVDANMLKPGEAAPTPNPVNSDAVFITDIGKQTGQGNAKALLCALLGKAEAEADADPTWFAGEIKKAVGNDQPYTGRPVRVATFRKPIKGGPNAGKPFTGYNWRPYAATAEEIAELRALLSKK
jgi:hypothetical protein